MNDCGGQPNHDLKIGRIGNSRTTGCQLGGVKVQPSKENEHKIHKYIDLIWFSRETSNSADGANQKKKLNKLFSIYLIKFINKIK